jgi:hypothetical protein
MTLIIAFTIISYTLYVLISIFTKDTYVLDQSSGEIRTTY